MSDDTLKQDLTPEDKAEETPQTEEPKAKDKKSDDTYYEKQIEELTASRNKVQEEKDNLLKALQQERAKAKETPPESESEPAAPVVDEERLAELISDVADKKFNEVRIDMALSVFEEELEKVSTNDKEKELIKMFYKTSIKPSGSDRTAIRKDLLISKAAANIDRVKFKTEDGDVALATAMSGSGGKAGGITKKELDLNPAEKKLLKNMGVSVEEARKALSE